MMNTVFDLANNYPGDEAWERFVSAFRSDWQVRSDKEFYLSFLHNEDLAIVLSWLMGQKSRDWFSQPCSALNNKTPDEVLEKEVKGKETLRTLLMRMPI